MNTADGRPLLLAIVGSTATGKSALALSVAEQVRGEIINCDSTAVYRRFDIGTDKVPAAQRHGVPHHLIDIAEPTEVYTAARYSRDAARAVRDISARNRLPVVVGGTGLLPGPDAGHFSRARSRPGPPCPAESGRPAPRC